ncbi:MAG TPA: branched-chain amino acid ABC transporter permease [Symbiobacteriaceae bacterium]|jgi:branched-chain amino acid transport system permease protein
MLSRLKADRWLLLAASVLLLLPLPKLLAANGLMAGDATALWPPTYYLQRGTEVFVYAVFALSYDILIGFTGIVSFGHSLFLALGAYSVAIVVMKLHLSIWVSLVVATLVSLTLSVAVGTLSLRLKGHYFAMITLAFAEVGYVLATKLSDWTGGQDGLSVRVPMWLVSRTNDYYVGLLFLMLMFLLVRRITRSPLGRVLEAIRENENRATALGYNVTAYKVAAMTVSGVVAGFAGVAMTIIDTRFAIASLATTGPTIEVLLMTVLGGAGTLIGPMIGAAVVRLLAYVLPGLTDISPLFQRWQFLLGLIYILTVLFLPFGIVGTYRARVSKALERVVHPPARKAAG